MSLRSTLETLASVLLFPTDFFSTRAIRVREASRVVLVVAGVYLLGYYLILLVGAVVASRHHYSLTVRELLADLTVGGYAQGVLVGLLVVLNWLVVSAVLHVAIKLRHGTGTYGDTLTVVGWSSPAALAALLVGGVGFLLAVGGNDLVTPYDAKIAAAHPAIRVAGVVGGLLTLLWQGHVWPPGLQRAHDVDRRAAAQATAVTFVVGALALVVGA